MSWPTPQDYNEAIQNPQTCFSDPELKQGNPALTPLGLPQPITGAFASVYRVDCPSRRWAVRCFLREYADQQRRYTAISDRLRAADLPCMVGFEFLREGIRISGRWYPVPKMEWIDGEPLNDYIARILSQADALRSLARRWIDPMTSLRKAQIAHGDLQHGNILVSGGELKLIDYDAMYVPALAGLESHEEGHRNYQHPDRTGRHFDTDVDNFSAWVIFTSISALAINPRLWKLPNAGDECLLFRREDFESPWSSRLLRNLEANDNLQLKTLVSHLRSILSLPISQIPSLDGSILDPQAKLDPGPGRSSQPKAQGLPNWLGDHIVRTERPAALEALHAEIVPAHSGGAEWLYDHLNLIDDQPVDHPWQPLIPRRERVVFWSFLGLLGLMMAAWGASWISGVVFTLIVVLAFMACVSILVLGYRISNPAEERKLVQWSLQDKRTAMAQIEVAINLSKLEQSRLGEPLVPIKRAYDGLPASRAAEFQQIDQESARALAGIEARRCKAGSDHERAIMILDDEPNGLAGELARALEGIEDRRRGVRADQEAALKQLEQRIQKEISALARQRVSQNADEKAEMSRLLEEARSLHVRVALSQATLSASALKGVVGETLVQRLWAAGVSCASDVSYERVREVPGIGDGRASGLVAWRNLIEKWAKSTAPTALSQAEWSRIRAEYASKARLLDQQIGDLKEKERAARQQIIQRSDDTMKALGDEEATIRGNFAEKRDVRRARYDAERARLVSDRDVVRRMLDSVVEAARRDHHLRRNAVQAKFEAERARLEAESKAEKAKVVQAQKRIEELLNELNRSLIQQKLEIRRAERELDMMSEFHPAAYLRMILGF